MNGESMRILMKALSLRLREAAEQTHKEAGYSISLFRF
jgi:hypothetical protein